jgi:4-hydroxythreonine-4-phosphate dehydrogenase
MKPIKPKIAITMGDPAGVGPELVLRALASRRVRKVARPFVIGDLGLLRRVAKLLDLKEPKENEVVNLSALKPSQTKAAHPTKESSEAMIGYIKEAATMAMDGRADAMVTAPINKEAAAMSGFRFPGHTEFLAKLTKTTDFAMMLGGTTLKVVLVTIHEPIKKLPRLVTEERVLKTIKITDDAFKKFGIKKPRIAVCGLNPHAGEAGKFGMEDLLKVTPAVKKARRAGINAIGPLPSDTVFYRTVIKKDFDVVVCMYHDQGLIPLKLLHFEDGVNTTLGLPIIRTSVDHGTAYDIARKGIASDKSIIAAIEAAAMMANKKR